MTPADSAAVLDDVARRYPAPIARAAARLADCATPLHRVYALIDLFEVTLKYCSIVMIQDYVRLGVHVPAVDQEIALHFRHPSLGHWNCFLREIVRACLPQRDALSVPPLADLLFDAKGAPRARQHRAFDRLIALRNAYGHQGRPSDDVWQARFEEHLPLMAELLAGLAFLADSPLVLKLGDGERHLCMGTAGHAPLDAPAEDTAVPAGQLYLRHGAAVLPLFPLLLYDRCGYATAEGPCDLAKIFFFNSIAHRRPEFIDYSMAHLKRPRALVDILKRIAEESARHVGGAEAGLDMISWELIQERARDLVGRAEPEQQMLDFLACEPRGYLLLEGAPGTGKTTLVSSLVRDLVDASQAEGRSAEITQRAAELRAAGITVAFHLCVAADRRTTDPAAIVASLTAQLAAQSGQASLAEARTAEALVGAARAALAARGGRVLLVLDGIDEALAAADEAGRAPLLDTLLLSRSHLPPGLYLLASARRGSFAGISLPAVPRLALELGGLARGELRELLFRVVDKFALPEDALDRVAALSDGNPLYVRMLAEDLAAGRIGVTQLDALPSGVEAYFESVVARMRGQADWPLVRHSLLLLAVAYESLSAAQIGAVLGASDAALKLPLDEELQAVLVEDAGADAQPRYRLFHEKFRAFLLDLYGGALPKVWARLARGTADTDTGALDAVRGRLVDYCRRWQTEPDAYKLRHLARHLADGGADDELVALVRDSAYLDAKLAALGDPLPLAEDVRLATRALLAQGRDGEIVALATSDRSYRRDGVAAALGAADASLAPRLRAIAGRLLDWHAGGAWPFGGNRGDATAVIGARRVAVQVAYDHGFDEILERAVTDALPQVRGMLPAYLYRFWCNRPDAGWALLERLSRRMIRLGLPDRRILEACTGLSMAILIYHFDQPAVAERLRRHWQESIGRLVHLRGLARAALYLIGKNLRWAMATQASYQPLNLTEMRASYGRGSDHATARRALADFAAPTRGYRDTLALLLDRQTPYDVLLMLIAERTLVLHGAREPAAMLQALDRLHREGCRWFRQSALYVAFHVLRKAERVEPAWLDLYAAMTDGAVRESRATFDTGHGVYPMIPHMAWAELVFDRHRPAGRTRFIPSFLEDALKLKDEDYAVRALAACEVLSVAYRRHDLALDALHGLIDTTSPRLREALVATLANIRFFDADIVDRYLARHAGAALQQGVAAATPTVRAGDFMTYVDEFMIDGLVRSDGFRAEIARAFDQAARARDLPALFDRILKWAMNLIAGREVLPVAPPPAVAASEGSR